MRRTDIDLNKMKKIGVITVPPNRLDQEDYREMTTDKKTTTETFFGRMQLCTYQDGENCILSMINDDNLVLAHFDNNAIFLLSQHAVLSPEQFINVMINLQECSNEMRYLLERNAYSGYSSFRLGNLNINFADIEIATEMPIDIAKEYILSSKDQEKSEDSRNYSPIGITYNTKRGTIEHKYVSQYGTNIEWFLNEMIRVNPDIRLLMSNVICRTAELDLKQIILEAVGDTYESFYWRNGKVSDATWEEILRSKNKFKDREVLEKIQAKASYQVSMRRGQNQQYKVYLPLKYVIEAFGRENKDMDRDFLLEWYDGDPDNGSIAINYALNDMLTAVKREDTSYMHSPRGLEEVKMYMRFLNQKAYDINKEIEEKIASRAHRKARNH